MGIKELIYDCWIAGHSVYKTQDVLRKEGHGILTPTEIHSYYDEWERDADDRGYQEG